MATNKPKKDYPNTWRPKSSGSEGPKKKTAKKTATKDYPNTWVPKSASSEGPKKRTPAKKTTKKK